MDFFLLAKTRAFPSSPDDLNPYLIGTLLIWRCSSSAISDFNRLNSIKVVTARNNRTNVSLVDFIAGAQIGKDKYR